MRDPNDPSKIVFDEDEQKRVNALLREERETTEARIRALFEPKVAEHATATAAMQAKIDDLKTQLEAATRAAGEPGPAVKELETKLTQATARIAEFETNFGTMKSRAEAAEGQLTTEKTARLADAKRTKVKDVMASQKMEFFDFEDTFASNLDKVLKIDESGKYVTVINPETGEARRNSAMEPMSLAEYLADFPKQKPWLVKAEPTIGGTGGRPAGELPEEQKNKSDLKKLAEAPEAEFRAQIDAIIANGGRG